MDLFAGSGNIMTERLNPVWTVWKGETLSMFKRDHNRRARRTYKQYMRTGDIREFNRSQRLLTNWDFD